MVQIKKTDPPAEDLDTDQETAVQGLTSNAELELLRGLYRAERKIGRLISEKEDAVEIHNAAIKAAKVERREIIKAVEDMKNGVQPLPLEY